jgi:cytochrome b subunit of formate dehydrogenase
MEEKWVVLRLNLYHRILHAIIMTSFLGLSLTGLPLKFSDHAWARTLAHLLGGFETAGFLHRVFALVTFGYFAAHLGYLVWFFKRRSDEPFFRFLIGPQSLVPGWKDVKDIAVNFRYFLGLGPGAKFDRWAYWEKFDYWAVFWGIAIIGSSGMILWFPEFFTRFFPGWVLNIASIVHSEEAVLATGFIFIFHYIHTHLRAEKFPLDEVIFTGRITEEEMRRERPLEYRRHVDKGTLDRLWTKPEKKSIDLLLRSIGYVALIVGIAIAVLLMASLFAGSA